MKLPWLSRSSRFTRTGLRRRPGRLRRLLSTASSESDPERVEVRCGSSGSVTIDLYDLWKHSDSTPLLIHLPSFAVPADDLPHRPTFLRRYPTAVINYRWTGPPSLTESPTTSTTTQVGHLDTPLHWPTPLHDVAFAYKWLTENLSPPRLGRRDVYVQGSYLGATLAASLALTESHSHAPMGVRGFIAHNGIYNWTMFFPEHKINKAAPATKSRRSKTTVEGGEAGDGASALRFLERHMPVWFKSPADLFDPFASPCLFFQTPGMLVPPSFAQTDAVLAMADKLAAMGIEGSPADLMMMASSSRGGKAPRRSALVFPPRKSTLKIPAGLLLHDTAGVGAGSGAATKTAKTKTKTKTTTKTTAKRRRKVRGNHFEAQATELAGLMRRSLEKLEIPLRMKWDEDLVDGDEVVRSRVRVEDVGEPTSGQGQQVVVNERGEELIRRWLVERISV